MSEARPGRASRPIQPPPSSAVDSLDNVGTVQSALAGLEELLQPQRASALPEAPPITRHNLWALVSVLNARLALDLAAARAAAELADEAAQPAGGAR